MIFIIDRHSFVDVITNSSSELFVFDSDKSLTMIKKILGDLVKVYNKTAETKKKFNHVYGRVEIIDEHNIDYVIDQLYEYYDSDFNDIFGSAPKLNFSSKLSNEEFRVLCDNHEIAKNKWIKDNRLLNLNKLQGKIFIRSKNDNTIPYSIMEFISNIFNARGAHLG